MPSFKDANALLKQLRDARTSRASVYLNVLRVDELFRQAVSRIDSLINTEELGPEFSAGFTGIFGVKLSGKQVHSSEYQIASADKALLIETAIRQDEKLYNVDDEIPSGALVHFVGESRIACDGEEATPDTTLLTAEFASLAQQRRVAQAKGSKLGTIVWTSKSRKYLAAIAYLESVVDIGHIYSYPSGRYGILARKEGESGDLLFLAPLWLWYEQANANP